MFVELMPLLAGRTVLITVAKVDDKTLRVNVIPHGKADDKPALKSPLKTRKGSPRSQVVPHFDQGNEQNIIDPG